MTASFNESHTIALKCHGYIFSDEDDSTDTDNQINCSELEFYKPPPLKIPKEKIIRIRASTAKGINKKNYLLENTNTIKKKKRKLSGKHLKGDRNFISTSNYYKVLEQSDSSSETGSENNLEIDKSSSISALKVKLRDQEAETENNGTENLNGIEIAKIKTRNERKKKEENSQQFKESQTLDIIGNDHTSNEPDLEKEVAKSDSRYFKRSIYRSRQRCKEVHLPNRNVDIFPVHRFCYLWPVFPERKINVSEITTLEARTSWNYISESTVYWSDKLVEQEYNEIIGTEEAVSSTMLLLRPSAMNIVDKFLKEINYVECLKVLGAFLIVYACNRINR